MSHHLHRLAFLSTHSSPLATPGLTKAGGMNVYIAELTRRLGRTGRSVDIFTRRDRPQLPRIVPLAHNVRVINLPAGPPQPLPPLQVHPWVPEFTRRVSDFVRAEGRSYDLVHSHYWLSGITGMTLASQWRRPHVAMFHTLGEVKNRARRAEREPPLRIDAEREIVRRADRLICATPHERDFLAQLYGAHRECVSVVPGGVDLERFRPGDRSAARRALGLESGPLALFVGRLEPLKGVDILLRAAALADLDRPLTLLVVGGDPDNGDERAPLQALCRDLRIVDRVRFVAAVGRADLPLYYQAADICVVPSYYESFGLVAVEALASGTPVIATRVGGLQHTVRDGQTGYLVSWRCPEPFAERMETLLENADLRERFGRAARDSVQQFAWTVVADQVVGVYEDLLDGYIAGVAPGCHTS
ncbi:MAG: glycosyltransferase [Dehalococcoidia bacterium]